MNKFLGLFLTGVLLSSSYAVAQTTTPTTPTKPNPHYSFERSFMPGLGYGIYMPKNQDSLGRFAGLLVEFLFYAKVEQDEANGPSHVRVYGKLHMMSSSKANVSDIFMYGAGLDMSLERNPKRTYLIPYFGLETGGLSNQKLGTTWYFTPLIGLHILSRQNLFINVQGSYVYPIKNFDSLQGYLMKATVNFSLW